MRNRLVAGVSLGVVVIESAKAGGSMITARFAAEQGRTVFALPGRIDHAESAGCLSLIRDGATLIRSSEDILSEISPMIAHPVSPDSKNDNQKIKEQLDLEPTEQKIFDVLQADILELEQIHQITKLPLSDVLAATTMLKFMGSLLNGTMEGLRSIKCIVAFLLLVHLNKDKFREPKVDRLRSWIYSTNDPLNLMLV